MGSCKGIDQGGVILSDEQVQELLELIDRADSGEFHLRYRDFSISVYEPVNVGKKSCQEDQA